MNTFENNCFKKYILFWFSQSVSELGSAMTGFALILWAYTMTGSALAVSVMSFCNYMPYIIMSLFAGAIVDVYSKKKVILIVDAVAAAGSSVMLACCAADVLQIWHIYVVNIVIGFMNAIQSPAVLVATGMLVPKEKLAKVSGMNSFSGNLVTTLAPVIASAVFAFGGIGAVLLMDLGSFFFAFFVLLFFIKIPERRAEHKAESPLYGCLTGLRFLAGHRGLLVIVVTLAAINFFSRLTYENILSPMILVRSGNDSMALGIVNTAMGIGGMIGGILVSVGWRMKDPVKMIYLPAAISFLAGDLVMGLGQNAVVWSFAAVAASLPIPFIMAGQNVIFYEMTPTEIQGKVFAVRNAIQFCTIPIGILLGGILADYVFEPFMQTETAAAVFGRLVGSGAGSGMAVMFLCTGVLGFTISVFACRRRELDELR